MIDMNGPDIEAVDEVKALILESVNAWKDYKKRVPSRGSQGARAPRSATRRRMFTLNSRDLRMWFSLISSDDFIPEGHGQVASGSTSLPDPVMYLRLKT